MGHNMRGVCRKITPMLNDMRKELIDTYGNYMDAIAENDDAAAEKMAHSLGSATGTCPRLDGTERAGDARMGGETTGNLTQRRNFGIIGTYRR